MRCSVMSMLLSFLLFFILLLWLFSCFAAMLLSIWSEKTFAFLRILDFPLLSVLRVCCHDSSVHTISSPFSSFHSQYYWYSMSLSIFFLSFEQLVVWIRYIMFCLPSLMMFAIYIKIQFLDFFTISPQSNAHFQRKREYASLDIDCEKIDIARCCVPTKMNHSLSHHNTNTHTNSHISLKWESTLLVWTEWWAKMMFLTRQPNTQNSHWIVSLFRLYISNCGWVSQSYRTKSWRTQFAKRPVDGK